MVESARATVEVEAEGTVSVLLRLDVEVHAGWLHELELVDQEKLDRVMAVQSRLNCLTLFATKEGRLEWQTAGAAHRVDQGVALAGQLQPASQDLLAAFEETTKDESKASVHRPSSIVVRHSVVASYKVSARSFVLLTPDARHLSSEFRWKFMNARRQPTTANYTPD